MLLKGFHGTTAHLARIIEKEGFKMTPDKKGVWGYGVYLFEADENGWRHAANWAHRTCLEKRLSCASKSQVVCALPLHRTTDEEKNLCSHPLSEDCPAGVVEVECDCKDEHYFHFDKHHKGLEILIARCKQLCKKTGRPYLTLFKKGSAILINEVEKEIGHRIKILKVHVPEPEPDHGWGVCLVVRDRDCIKSRRVVCEGNL